MGKLTEKLSIDFVPKYGERVIVTVVNKSGDGFPCDAIFLAEIPTGYICQGVISFKAGGREEITIFPHMKQIVHKPSYTIEEIAKKLGHNPGEFIIAGLYG